MKFELPEDMVLVLEPSENNYLGHYFPSSRALETRSVLEDQYRHSIKVQEDIEDVEANFHIMQIAIDDYNEASVQNTIARAKKAVQHIQNLIDLNKSMANKSSQLIENDFRSSILLQNKEVEEIVQAELERIRLEHETKRRKEEDLRRRKEEEKRKKELELKLKKEEEEKKKQEEEERKRLEHQKKQKEEETKKTEALKKKAEDDEKRRKEIEQKKQQDAQLSKSKEKSALFFTDFDRIANEFINYKKIILDIKNNIVAPVSSDPILKKNIYALRRKINPKFGQLSNSLTQWRKIHSEILELIKLAASQEMSKKWILNYVAKAIVDQAETEVIVRPGAALPLAYLACSLLTEFPDFEYFLTARFAKKCPFIIGYSRSIDTEEGRLQMGWKRKDNKWEDDVKYDERISGICTVWSTMTRLSDFGPQRPFFSFEASWKFLARLLNTDADLLSNAHFSLAANWWEVTAPFFLQKYGNQSRKLMFTLSAQWTVSVRDKRFPAAARLLILGEDWVENNKFETPPEMTP